MSTHADHYTTNFGYGATSYSKGEMFLHQLAPVIGDRNVHEGLKRYYATCRFKHPEPIDVQRVMEKQSGLQLDWYFDGWINTTRKLDYGIRSVLAVNGELRIELERLGEQLMPVDVRVEYRDGRNASYHIPLSLERGVKKATAEALPFTAVDPWQWTDPTYLLIIPGPLAAVATVTIDPLGRTAEIDVTNNRVEFPEGTEGFAKP